MILAIDIFLTVLAAYLVIGMLFSVYFYWKGDAQIDEGTKGAPWHFKAILFPGVVLFWIVLLARLIRKP